MAIPKILNAVLRALEFLWTLLVMALVGNMIAEASGGNPSIVNYAMFVAVFSMLCLFWLFPATFVESLVFHPILMVAIDLLNTLFWFCGAVAFAAYLGAHSCDDGNYTHSNYITAGTYEGNQSKRCREGQAATAFLWFGFAAFATSTVLSGLQSRSSSTMGTGRSGGGGRRGGPSMSQV